MTLNEEIAKIAGLIADKTRAAMLMSLLAGKALTAGELALRANISPQTASNHLKKLQTAKLIVHVPTPTRYRYYKISSPLVAKALESLSVLTESKKIRPPRHAMLDKDICFARTCYDHLAGELGVKITSSLLKNSFLKLEDEHFIVTETGKSFVKLFGVNYDELIKLRRPLAKPCLDWTEREYHLAGSLGNAMLDYFMNTRILIRAKNKTRVVLLTTKGEHWLQENLTLEIKS